MTKFKNFYSPNFDQVKRRNSNIKYLIYHYTGMKSEKSALKRLCDTRSKVSCHYFIKKNGEILQIVPDRYISWHAGKSRWKNDNLLNKSSIGIEIHNSGHSFNYTNFNNNQIISIKNLSNLLIKEYRIKRHNVLGHSDISPDRKKDPGEKFPWRKLNTYKIGIWHSLDNRLLQKMRNREILKNQSKIFVKFIKKIGFNFNAQNKKNFKYTVKAFQRHFRPQIINGIIDIECLEIAKNLSKKCLY